jgi:hypothetical protein
MKTAHKYGNVVSLTLWPPLPPGNTPGTQSPGTTKDSQILTIPFLHKTYVSSPKFLEFLY